MRCPYCGGINSDRTPYCIHCGRDLTLQASNQPASRPQPPYQQPRQAPQPPQPQARPAGPQTPYQQPRQAPPAPGRRPPASPPPAARQPAPPEPPPPEPPAPFPPGNVAELQTLEQGALPYNVVGSTVSDGRKKIVRITFKKGVPWQQVATLLKAFKEQQEEQFDTIIIQGVSAEDTNIYSFTTGQLTFDRHVRLGSMITNRYLIETGNGYESDSVRIVLSE